VTSPKRKSRPWAVILSTPSSLVRTEHTSEAKAYEQVRNEIADVKTGASQITRVRVEQWDRQAGRWQLFDLIDPKE
jgi:hypothetical protein